MSTMGPKPKARARKLLSATLRGDRDRVSDENASGASTPPLPPAWLPAHAKTEFARVGALLASRAAIHESTPAQLSFFVCLSAQLAVTFAAGRAPTGSALTQHRALARALGLDDSGQAPAPGKVNKFRNNWLAAEENRRRTRGRRK